MVNLFGDPLLETTSVEDTKVLRNKIKSTTKTTQEKTSAKSAKIIEQIARIRKEVDRILGRYKHNTIVIRDKETLHKYIDKALENGICAVDTETNNTLDTIEGKIMGGCLYTPGMKQAYIPINHIDVYTRNKLPNQLTEEELGEELARLTNGTRLIYHNAKFDISVIKSTCGVRLPYYWDTSIGARLLDENESASLKEQYRLHIDSSQEKYSIDHLFEGMEYAIFEPELFALYAATDPYITFKLYEYQEKEFNKEENVGVFRVFKDVEMPVLEAVTDMELTGIELDLEYHHRLYNKYLSIQDRMKNDLQQEIEKVRPAIDVWRKTTQANEKTIGKNGSVGKSKSEQLDEIVNVDSPTQMAILLYDILKMPVVDEKQPRSTGKSAMKVFAEQYNQPICQKMLEYKEFQKLIDSFLEPLPKLVKKSTDRVHCNYNQLGTSTGRFSCSDPNL